MVNAKSALEQYPRDTRTGSLTATFTAQFNLTVDLNVIEKRIANHDPRGQATHGVYFQVRDIAHHVAGS
jgi:hypothetical protein